MTYTDMSIATAAAGRSGAKTDPTYETTCRGCKRGWNGLKTCHCGACHQTFSTVKAFDQHRRGTYEPDTRHCVNPADAGLILIGRHYECWGRAYGE